MQMQKAHDLFETGAATHVGKIRSRNEDSYLVRPDTGLWVVADGMGGHEDGDFASRTVVEALKSIDAPGSARELLSLCEERIFHANSIIQQTSRQRGSIIGTTVAVLLTFDNYFASLWCGDSRTYIIRNGKIAQISRDHNEVQELLQNGVITAEEARHWKGSNAITRAIGVVESPELEMTSDPLNADDIFVMCTDGLTNHVADDEILRCVTADASQQACDNLVAMTLERGAVDNVTVIVVRYKPQGATQHRAGDTLAPVPEQLE